MKAVTEFASITLNRALKMRSDLTAEGKTPEEIQQSLSETFKLEGDKLKYFINALDVAGHNTDKLKRVLVMSLSEGENPPNKATKVEELHYVPDFYVEAKPAAAKAAAGKGGRQGGRGDRGDRGSGKPKTSPWGLTPEEKAAKTAGKGAPGKSNKPH